MNELVKIVSSHKEKYIEKRREFQNREFPDSYMSFPCDDNGIPQIDDDNKAAKENYAFALAHPERYKDLGIVEQEYWNTVPAEATCSCGATFYLRDQYMGACDCPGCGQWYNLFGQQLKSPYEYPEDWE